MGEERTEGGKTGERRDRGKRGTERGEVEKEGWLVVEWGVYALSASKAIFRARTYNCNLFSPVMMIT